MELMIMLTLVIQSSIGIALSLTHLLTDTGLPLKVLLSERQEGFFTIFCVTGFVINTLLLSLAVVWFLLRVAVFILTRWMENQENTRQYRGRGQRQRLYREEEVTYTYGSLWR